MSKTTRITKVDRRGSRATIITYRGGGAKGQLEIPGGMQEFRRWILAQAGESHELLVALALASWLAKNPTENSDFSAVEGKQITLDLTADTTAGIVTIV